MKAGFDAAALRQQALRHYQAGEHRKAISVGTAVLPQFAKDVTLLHMLAICLASESRRDEAVVYIKRCLALKPRDPGLLADLARIRIGQGRFDEALSCYDRALRLKPDFPLAISGKASVLQRRGMQREAMDVLQPFVNAGVEDALMAIVYAKAQQSLGEFAESLAIAKKHVGDQGLDVVNRRDLHELLAKAHEKLGNFDEAFAEYQNSNRVGAAPFNREAYAGEIDELIGVFSAEHMASFPRSTNDSQLPVFIASMPRSGSTLVEQIIHAHPEAHGAGEIVEFNEIVFKLPDRIGSFQPYPRCLADLTIQAADELADEYLGKLRTFSASAARIANKNLFNYRHLGMVALLFPQAKIIHVRRNPLDTCFSCFMAALDPRAHPFAIDLPSLGFAYREYHRLMEHWRELLGDSILQIEYESLVANPDVEIRRLISFLQLPWDDRCLNFHTADRDVLTLSYDQVRRPIYTTAVNRFQNYEKHLGPLRDALGDLI